MKKLVFSAVLILSLTTLAGCGRTEAGVSEKEELQGIFSVTPDWTQDVTSWTCDGRTVKYFTGASIFDFEKMLNDIGATDIVWDQGETNEPSFPEATTLTFVYKDFSFYGTTAVNLDTNEAIHFLYITRLGDDKHTYMAMKEDFYSRLYSQTEDEVFEKQEKLYHKMVSGKFLFDLDKKFFTDWETANDLFLVLFEGNYDSEVPFQGVMQYIDIGDSIVYDENCKKICELSDELV